MFSLGNDDDPLDFSLAPKGSKGLKNLFGGHSNQAESPDSEASLKFSAPKQPKSTTNEQNQGVWMAIVANVYLYQSNKYDAKGKLGIAITKANTVMIYGQQKRVITNCVISETLVFTIVADSFATFYDSNHQCWGIQFSSMDEAKKFLVQVALVKFSLIEKLVVQQTNYCTSSVRIEKEDEIKVRYVGWLIDGVQLSTQFDSNESFSLNITKSHVIEAWKKGLLNCVENGIYYIITDSSMAYGSKSVGKIIAPHSSLAFEVEILSISKPTSFQRSPTLSNELTDSSVESYSTKPKRSGSENIPQKNDILSRMAKMGAQPAFPTTQQIPSSPDMEPEARSRHSSIRSNRSRKKAPRSGNSEVDAPQIPVKPSPGLVNHYMTNNQTSLVPSGMYHPYSQPMNSQYIPQTPAPEIKETLDVSKNLDKSVRNLEAILQSVQSNVSTLVEQAVLYNNNVKNCPSSETQVLMHNVQRIVAENDNLRDEVSNKNKIIEDQSAKITKILNRNQELMNAKNEAVEATQNNFLANSSQNAQQIRVLEEENEQMRNELKKHKTISNDFEFELSTKDKQINSLKSQIEALYVENNSVQESLFESRTQLSKLKMSMSSSGSQEEMLQQEINRMKEKIQNSFSEKLTLSQQIDDLCLKEKQIMADYELKLKRANKEIESLKSNDAVQAMEKCFEEQIKELQASQACANDELKTVNTKLDSLQKTYGTLLAKHSDLDTEHRNTLAALSSLQDQFSDEVQSGKEYKKQILLLENELRNKNEELLKITTQLQEMKDSESPGSSDNTEVVNAKVKDILNTFFRQYREGIITTNKYTGEHVLSLAIKTIKSVTLSMLSGNSEKISEDEASDEEEGSSEDSEESGSDDENDSDDSDDGHDDGDAGNVVANDPNDIQEAAQTSDSTEFQVHNTPTDILARPICPDHPTPGPSSMSDDNDCSFVVGENTEVIEDTSTVVSIEKPEIVVDEAPLPQREEPPAPLVAPEPPAAEHAPEEFTTHNDEEELFDQPAPSEPPPSPAPASFEPNVHDSVVNVEDISSISAEVFGDTPESVRTSPSQHRRERPPPLFSDSEDDGLDFLT